MKKEYITPDLFIEQVNVIKIICTSTESIENGGNGNGKPAGVKGFDYTINDDITYDVSFEI